MRVDKTERVQLGTFDVFRVHENLLSAEQKTALHALIKASYKASLGVDKGDSASASASSSSTATHSTFCKSKASDKKAEERITSRANLLKFFGR